MNYKLGLSAWIEEKGSSLFIVIFILLLLSMLGSILFNASGNDLMMAKNQRSEAEANYLAEAGTEIVLFWFNNPEKFKEAAYFKNNYNGKPEDFFKKRMTDKFGTPTFLTDGISQFSGTKDNPDLEYDLSSNSYQFDSTLDSLKKIGKIKSIKVYSTKREGGICTIESVGETNNGTIRSVMMEVKGSPLPPLTAPLQSGNGDINIVPIKVHWGDIRIIGGGNLGDDLTMIPKKNQISIPDGQDYVADNREDGWLDIYVGKEIVSPSEKGCTDCKEPYSNLGHENIYQFQEADIALDRWDYSELKAYAKEYGRYFSADYDGNLYQNGILDQNHKRSLNEVMTSIAPGDSKGFVFVDTVDGNPPNKSNIPTLEINRGYSEGIFYVNGNLVIKNEESGFSIDSKTPPWEGRTGDETRMPVTLQDINLNGAIYSTGSVADRKSVV